jgi:hypothetical protein
MRRLCVLCLALFTPAASAGEKIRVLLIDGQNNHAWQQTTPILKRQLEGCGRFAVDVATSPPAAEYPPLPKDATPERKRKHDAEVEVIRAARRALFDKFRPDLAKYQVVVGNYNGEPWSDATNAEFERLLKAGKIGYVVVHAANNAFEGWGEYNQMIGMGWRGNKGGDRLYLDDAGKEVRVESGNGDGSGHRYTGPFTVTVRDPDHPVTKGMPREWLHTRDELYDNMRGPIRNVRVLATAYSDQAKKGTGVHEPMIWTVTYGGGRVFHTPMGHDATAMRCHGFAATLQRGTEWAATGAVTIPLPKAFPTADTPSPIVEK